ncbi:MAG TPA: transglutaminase domain-containing protein [Verrucomicrobiae bacterium]|jgi:transglutaminase-like putative cysteine protease
MRLILGGLLSVLLLSQLHATTTDEITTLVDQGHWRQAQQEIAQELAQTNLSFSTQEELRFQADRMLRIRRDFSQTRDQVYQKIRATMPGVTDQQLAQWEQSGAIEFLDIDGTHWYFNKAADNVFRLAPEAKAFKAAQHPSHAEMDDLLNDVHEYVAGYDQTKSPWHSPQTWQVTYTLSVPAGTVPPGEIIRAWLPWPHSGNRQSNIRLLATDPPQFLPAPTNEALASVYLEKPALTNAPTEFKLVFKYTSTAYYQPIDPAIVVPAATNDPALTPFMGEEPPHIVFDDAFKTISTKVIGDETNPYRKAQRIFEWVFRNVTWTTAREYSTITCLPELALGMHHGDCGMKTMTFMTLCRLNGIPARWETGWVVSDNSDMHDWCAIYLAPYGWVPVDVTRGVLPAKTEAEKWFYLGGMDPARLVVNTDFNQPLYPAKTHFRSEIVDFQRGEVEWRGGNLYFNQWGWNFDAKRIK